MQQPCLLRQTLRRGQMAIALDPLVVACTRVEGNTVTPGHITMEPVPRRPGLDRHGFPILKIFKIKRRRWM